MRRRSQFNYGAGVFVASLSSPAWTPKDATVGGMRVAAAGVPATYVVRRDALLDLVLRFTEDEWPDVLALIQFGQSGQAITWTPDVDELATFDVYLDAPAAGTSWAPARDAAFPRTLTATLTLRGVNGLPPWVGYFADDD
jgi:hypothetical protein